MPKKYQAKKHTKDEKELIALVRRLSKKFKVKGGGKRKKRSVRKRRTRRTRRSRR
jgi:hypothetical protein